MGLSASETLPFYVFNSPRFKNFPPARETV